MIDEGPINSSKSKKKLVSEKPKVSKLDESPKESGGYCDSSISRCDLRDFTRSSKSNFSIYDGADVSRGASDNLKLDKSKVEVGLPELVSLSESDSDLLRPNKSKYKVSTSMSPNFGPLPKETKIWEPLETRVTRLEKEIKKLTIERFPKTLLGDEEYIPYVISAEYLARNNKSILRGSVLHLNVEVVGHYSSPLVIFPFGNQSIAPRFESAPLLLLMTDIKETRGVLLGMFTLDPRDSLYKITITKYFRYPFEEEETSPHHFTLPLIINHEVLLRPRDT
jgi:hypothetical protein